MESARTLPVVLRLALVAGLGAATPAAAQTITRGPYLQLLTTRSVTVVWRTDVAATCALAIGPPDGARHIVTGESGDTCAIPIEGLTAGAQYDYVPMADGEPLAAESVFRADDPSLPLIFLVIGDHGSNTSSSRRPCAIVCWNRRPTSSSRSAT